MDGREYLLSYGKLGDFGRFSSAQSLDCRRGDRLIVRTPRGVEVGVVMQRATPGHARLLANPAGEILRPASPADELVAQQRLEAGQRLYTRGRRLAAALPLPMEILDAEVLLDGQRGILHYLRWAECDPRPLMDELGEEFRLLLVLQDLAPPIASVVSPEVGCGAGGCGSGGCGSCDAGGCSHCGVARKRPAALNSPVAGSSALPASVAESSSRLSLL